MANKFKIYLQSKLNVDLINDIKYDIKNIEIYSIDNLYVLYFNNIKSTIFKNEIDFDTYNLCIFNNTLDLFYIDKKTILVQKNEIINIFSNFSNCNIYENTGDVVYIISHFNKIYILYKYNMSYRIDKIENVIYKKIFDNYVFLSDNAVEKITLIHNKYNKLLYYKNDVIYENYLKYKEKKIYFSGIDELIFDLEKMSNIIETKKKITSNGYIIEYNNNDYIINYNIYQKIIDIMPYYSNINKCFIELYKNDNLSFMISYMTSYCNNILNRVNLSIKNISKELLNMYHFTRKRQNIELINILTNTYNILLSDLHKIFLYSNKYDEILMENKDKISMNNDIVYKYIKTININLLIQLYIDRNDIVEKFKNIKFNFDEFVNTPTHYKIIFVDCINTKTLSALLLQNYNNN